MNLPRPELPSSRTQCDVCRKRFKRPQDVNRHKRTHTGRRFRFLCKVPDCLFNGAFRKDDLQKHMRKAHGMQNTKGRVIQDEFQVAYKQSLKEQESLTGCFDLLSAAEIGSEQLVQQLIDIGADTAMEWKELSDALVIAVAGGHEAVVQLLLKKGADVEARDLNTRETALWWAAGNGHEAIVRLLLEKGANIEGKCSDAMRRFSGQTALSRAAENGHEAIVRLLLEKGADIEGGGYYFIKGQTALLRAAENGHEAIVRLLLEKGADIEGGGYYFIKGQTALLRAAENGHEAIVRLLLENGANIQAKPYGRPSVLSRAAENGHETIVRLLLKKGADVEEKDRSGRTALSRAEGKGHEAIVRLLMEKGADP